MNIIIPADVNFVLSTLENYGFEAFIVGGCVRDYLLGLTPYDWDICTNAHPDRVCEVFKDYNIIKTGISHGTVTLIYNKKPYEITTFRSDGNYLDNRHPNKVTFVGSLKEDLARRDFTVNALAYNEKDGLIDLFYGLEDLKNKIIRTVGNPKKRFEEDGLRILRALRFSSKLSFEIEESTHLAIKESAHLLKNISKERVREEFFKIINGENSKNVLLNYEKIFYEFLPPSPYFKDGVNSIKPGFSDIFTLSLFFVVLYNENATAVLKTLKCSNKTLDYTKKLWCLTAKNPTLSKSEICKCFYEFGENVCIPYFAYFYGAEATALTEEIKLENVPCSLKELKIKGSDLSVTGKHIKTALTSALYAVMDGKIKNEKEELLKYINSTQEKSHE